MACRTFGQALDEANKLDAEWQTDHRGKAVICQMLAHISSKRTRTLAKSTTASKATRPDSGPQAPRSAGGQGVGKMAPARPLVKSRVAAAPKKPQRAWTAAQVVAALDDGVARGSISGTAAVAAMHAFEGKR